MIDLDALALLAPPHGEGTVHLRTSLFLELLEELGKIRNLLLQTTLDPTDGRALLPDDVRALATILHAMQTGGHSEAIRGIERYYRDSARADRTPRATLYLHFGYVLNHLTKGQR